jgi:cytochrome c551/c552
LTVLVSALVVVVAGCGGPNLKGVTTPTPETIIGKAPTPTTGDPAAGKELFVRTGCGACHIFTPAGTTGTIGPNLDNLPAYAKAANQGTLEQFINTSIVNPTAYIAPGYKSGLMPVSYGQQLGAKGVADIVAFLAKGP